MTIRAFPAGRSGSRALLIRLQALFAKCRYPRRPLTRLQRNPGARMPGKGRSAEFSCQSVYYGLPGVVNINLVEPMIGWPA
ncbi:MAG TPA: hypothetical protein VNW95_16955 [Mucilaginibacter sp.]|nr:hypothetical protein [Mucilaginibacter sp.]